MSTAEHLAEVLSKAGKPFHRLSPDAIAADVTALELVAREFQPKGAPSKEALAVYVGRLADLWGRVHQRRPTRVVATGAPARGKLSAAHAAGDEIGAFSRFVETCLSAAGFTGKRPDGIIRKVIAGGRRERNGEKYQVGKTRRPQ